MSSGRHSKYLKQYMDTVVCKCMIYWILVCKIFFIFKRNCFLRLNLNVKTIRLIQNYGHIFNKNKFNKFKSKSRRNSAIRTYRRKNQKKHLSLDWESKMIALFIWYVLENVNNYYILTEYYGIVPVPILMCFFFNNKIQLV